MEKTSEQPVELTDSGDCIAPKARDHAASTMSTMFHLGIDYHPVSTYDALACVAADNADPTRLSSNWLIAWYNKRRFLPPRLRGAKFHGQLEVAAEIYRRMMIEAAVSETRREDPAALVTIKHLTQPQ